MVVLFYGQPASGKTTLADRLVGLFGKAVVRLDGDVWREITNNKDYSDSGRRANLKSACDMARILHLQGYATIMSFVFPFNDLREYLASHTQLVQIYLTCDVDRGRNHYHVQNFEEPTLDCLRINTSDISIDECLHEIKNYIKEKTGYDTDEELG